jgi:hypothetical protein
MYGGVDVQIHVFLTSAVVGGEWSASCPYRFTLVERAPYTRWTGGWVVPRADLDDMEKWKFLTLLELELRLLLSIPCPVAIPTALSWLLLIWSWSHSNSIIFYLCISFHIKLTNISHGNCSMRFSNYCLSVTRSVLMIRKILSQVAWTKWCPVDSL